MLFDSAQRVVLDRHHTPPVPLRVAVLNAGAEAATLTEHPHGWEVSGARTRAGHANTADATRDAAYGVAISAAGAHLNLVALSRAECLTGSDWYLGPPGQPMGAEEDDLERSVKLEVSGVDAGDRSRILERVEQKLTQAEEGDSDLPAVAAVVAFRERLVVLAELERVRIGNG